MSMRIVVGASALLTMAPWGGVRAQADLSALQRFYQEARFAEFDAAVARTPERSLSPLDYSRFQQLRGFAALARRDTTGARRFFVEAIRPGGGAPADSMLHAPGRRRLYESLRLEAPVLDSLVPADREWLSLAQPLRLTPIVSLSGVGVGGTSVEAMWCQRAAWRADGGWQCEPVGAPSARAAAGATLELAMTESHGAAHAPSSGTYFVPTASTRGGLRVEQLWRIALETEAPLGLQVPASLDAPAFRPETKRVAAGRWLAPFALGGTLYGVWKALDEGGRASDCEDCASVGWKIAGWSYAVYILSLVIKKTVPDAAAIAANRRMAEEHQSAEAARQRRIEEMRRRTISRVVRVERVQ